MCQDNLKEKYTEYMKILNNAKEILTNDEKRLSYDYEIGIYKDEGYL